MIGLIWTHFVADFLLQNTWMSENKSRSLVALMVHSIVYGLPFVLIYGPVFGLVTLTLHGLVDLLSSKLTKYLYEQKEWHWFFVVIGLDQAIHMTLLLETAKVLGAF